MTKMAFDGRTRLRIKNNKWQKNISSRNGLVGRFASEERGVAGVCVFACFACFACTGCLLVRSLKTLPPLKSSLNTLHPLKSVVMTCIDPLESWEGAEWCYSLFILPALVLPFIRSLIVFGVFSYSSSILFFSFVVFFRFVCALLCMRVFPCVAIMEAV